MSAQTTYSQSTPRGAAGGLYDLSGHAVNTRINAETGLTMKFGLGVVQGSVPGSEIKLPAAGATADKFEGITVNGYTNEMNSEGAVFISPGASIGVLQYGKIWARIKPEDAPAYGDKLYLIISGANAGLFTKTSGADAIEVPGRFIGGKGTGDTAPVELFYQAAGASSSGGGVSSLGDLSDVDLTTAATDGQVLKYDNASSKWKAGDYATGS